MPFGVVPADSSYVYGRAHPQFIWKIKAFLKLYNMI